MAARVPFIAILATEPSPTDQVALRLGDSLVRRMRSGATCYLVALDFGQT